MEDVLSDCQDGKKNSDDKKISLALMSSFLILMLQYFVLVYSNLLDLESGSRVQLISKILVALAFLYALPTVLKRSKIKTIGIYGLSIFIFLLQYSIFSENREYIVRLVFPFFFMSLPAFIYALSIHDFEVLKRIMKKFSYVIFLVGALIGILVFFGKSSVGVYSMSLSYYMLLPTILFLDELLDKFSFKTLLLVGLSLIIILALGSRGPLLSGAIFIALKFIRSSSNRTYKRIMGDLSIIGISMYIIVFLNKILMYLQSTLQMSGINSRTLKLLLREDIYLSGRDQIYKIVINEIMNKPIIGIGIAGDTRIIGAGYVHNFFIEVIGNFGVLIGLIVILIFILLVVNSLFTKDMNNYNMAIIWLSLGFVHLMVSSSYLIDIKFWIFLGIVLNIQKNEKRHMLNL